MVLSDPKVGRFERWAISLYERRPYAFFVACILIQSAIAMVMAQFPYFHGGTGTYNLFHDLMIYHEYASRIFAGEVPYRDFVVEYPPLSIPLFLLPRLVGSAYPTYRVAFDVEMLAFNALTFVLAVRWSSAWHGTSGVPRCAAWYTMFFLMCNPVAMARYDLAVTFLSFAASAWLLSGSAALGGATASAAALMKVIPGVAAAPAFLRELADLRASRGRGLLTSILVFTAGACAWVALGRGGIVKTFEYHAERGLEKGSIYAGALALAAKLRGVDLKPSFNHWADHFDSPAAMRLASAAPYLQLGAFALALGAYWRSGMRDGLRYSAACLMAFVVLGKILSPQYLIWLIPFVACLRGRSGARAQWAFLAACTLTLTIYPYGRVLAPQYLIWLIPFVACLLQRSGARDRWTFLATCAIAAAVAGTCLLVIPGWCILLISTGRNLLLIALFILLVFDRAVDGGPDRGRRYQLVLPSGRSVDRGVP